MAFCGDYRPNCADKFTECMLDEANTAFCAAQMGQTTDIDCDQFLNEKYNE